MKWFQVLLLILPYTTAQIIFPEEPEPVSTIITPIRTTSASPFSARSDIILTSSISSNTDDLSSLLHASPTTIFSSISPSSTSLTLDSAILATLGSVSKASTIPILSPSPVASETVATSTSLQQTFVRPPPFLSLHPGVPNIAPVTPTPINVPITEFTPIPEEFGAFDYDYNYPKDSFSIPSSPILPISPFGTAPLNSTLSLGSSSGSFRNTSSTTLSTDESDHTSTVSPILDTENSSTPETTPNPEVYDEILVNAIITMGDREGVTMGSNNTCITPLGENGTCTVLKSCAGYSPLTDNIGDSIATTFLRTRVCRLLPRSILFCCPEGKAILPLGF